VGKAGFNIHEDEIEVGMGIHGEPGIRVEKLKNADDITDDMMNTLLADMPLGEGDEVAVLVNGLGATPLDELYIIFNRIADILNGKKIGIFSTWVGEYVTSMEMAGASVSLCKVDEELKRLLGAHTNTPFFKQFTI
jgi:dihydroxyacetone kinase-like protein